MFSAPTLCVVIGALMSVSCPAIAVPLADTSRDNDQEVHRQRRANDPPQTWKEHWFEHNQTVQLQFFDANDAIYYDSNMDTTITWPRTYFSQVWSFVKRKYGSFGDDPRVYVILHTLKYSGGHPSTYMDGSHDWRNVIDCGSLNPNTWKTGGSSDLSIPTHEVGHIVELASKNVKGSPAFGIWHDSKWNEIFIYDVYKSLGRTSDAQSWYDSVIPGSDSFPRANTHWFKDWFYPIYSQLGSPDSLNSYFDLLSLYFPKHPYGTTVPGNTATLYEYDRRLNYGEFIHFWSGAAKIDLKSLALTAFGNLDEQGNDWTTQLTQAQTDFAQLKYNKDITSQATLTVSKENYAGATAEEGSVKLKDGLYNTKFFLWGYSTSFWVQLEFPSARIIREYTITSGNDAPDRDPKTWFVAGSHDGATFTTVDSRSNEMFSSRIQTKRYSINYPLDYKYYKLFVTGNNGSPDLQIGEWGVLQ